MSHPPQSLNRGCNYFSSFLFASFPDVGGSYYFVFLGNSLRSVLSGIIFQHPKEILAAYLGIGIEDTGLSVGGSWRTSQRRIYPLSLDHVGPIRSVFSASS